MVHNVEVKNQVEFLTRENAAVAAVFAANYISRIDGAFAIRIDYLDSTVRLAFQVSHPIQVPGSLKKGVSRISWESRTHYFEYCDCILYTRVCDLYFDFSC